VLYRAVSNRGKQALASEHARLALGGGAARSPVPRGGVGNASRGLSGGVLRASVGPSVYGPGPELALMPWSEPVTARRGVRRFGVVHQAVCCSIGAGTALAGARLLALTRRCAGSGHEKDRGLRRSTISSTGSRRRVACSRSLRGCWPRIHRRCLRCRPVSVDDVAAADPAIRPGIASPRRQSGRRHCSRYGGRTPTRLRRRSRRFCMSGAFLRGLLTD